MLFDLAGIYFDRHPPLQEQFPLLCNEKDLVQVDIRCRNRVLDTKIGRVHDQDLSCFAIELILNTHPIKGAAAKQGRMFEVAQDGMNRRELAGMRIKGCQKSMRVVLIAPGIHRVLVIIKSLYVQDGPGRCRSPLRNSRSGVDRIDAGRSIRVKNTIVQYRIGIVELVTVRPELLEVRFGKRNDLPALITGAGGARRDKNLVSTKNKAGRVAVLTRRPYIILGAKIDRIDISILRVHVIARIQDIERAAILPTELTIAEKRLSVHDATLTGAVVQGRDSPNVRRVDAVLEVKGRISI